MYLISLLTTQDHRLDDPNAVLVHLVSDLLLLGVANLLGKHR